MNGRPLRPETDDNFFVFDVHHCVECSMKCNGRSYWSHFIIIFQYVVMWSTAEHGRSDHLCMCVCLECRIFFSYLDTWWRRTHQFSLFNSAENSRWTLKTNSNNIEKKILSINWNNTKTNDITSAKLLSNDFGGIVNSGDSGKWHPNNYCEKHETNNK